VKKKPVLEKEQAVRSVVMQIEKLVQGGDGLGRHEGRAVFVPYTAPAETVAVSLRVDKGDYVEGRVTKILVPSPDRRPPPCPLFGECGGCQLQHLTEQAQAQHKADTLAETLTRIGKIADPPLSPVIASPRSFGYRRRARFQVQKGEIGFYRRKSHQIVPVAHCPLLPPTLNDLLTRVRTDLPRDGLNEVELQAGDERGLLVILRGKKVRPETGQRFYEAARADGVAGVIVERGAKRYRFGSDHLLYRTGAEGWVLRVGDQAFLQINGEANLLVIEALMKEIDPNESILELYSGAGNHTLHLARRAASVVAVEVNPTAVGDARHNLRGCSNVTLLNIGVDEAITTADPVTRVVLNPPREGASGEVLAGIVKMRPRAISYLSCDPATLARDLAYLCQNGYRLQSVQPFDLFPQTGHIEVLAQLVWQGGIAG
jgi:23S rRNA (uracil1939-C5)-methyltransferase